MARRFFKKYRKGIVRIWTAANLMVFILAAFRLDSESSILGIVCAATLLWLGLFAYANRYFEKVVRFFNNNPALAQNRAKNKEWRSKGWR